MKKKIAIIRFGVSSPLPKEIPVISEIAGDRMDCAMGIGFFAGIIHLVYTETHPKEVAKLFKECAESTGDKLPVVVFELDGPDVAMHLADFHGIEASLAEFNRACDNPTESSRYQVDLSLDELLDLVSRRGSFDKLSTEEREQLEKLSRKL